MDIHKVMEQGLLDFTGIPSGYFLLGLLTAFDNRFQASADKVMEQVSWKQFFAVVCINLCRQAPTLRELGEIMGCSHQNARQLLLKLENRGFVELRTDEADRRKQRIYLTDACRDFCREHEEITGKIMDRMFGSISEQDLQTTIQTILKIEENLKEIS